MKINQKMDAWPAKKWIIDWPSNGRLEQGEATPAAGVCWVNSRRRTTHGVSLL